jgi:hypothetical protein
VPVERWLAAAWKPQLECLLSDSPYLETEGWIARGSLKAAVQKALDGRRVPTQIWSLVVLEQWLRTNGARTGMVAGVPSAC